MKRQFLTVLLAAAAINAQASSGSIRFYGALVEPTCQTESVGRASGMAQGALRLSECRMSIIRTSDAGGRLDSSRVFSSGLKEIALSAPTAQLTGRATVQELVISYQ